MNKNLKKKKILLSVTALVLVAAIGGGIWFGVSHKGGEPVYVFEFMNVGMTEYWGDSQESYGPVSSDNIQTVFLSDTQTVVSVAVKEGDTVKEGDLLMSFDTSLTDLELERSRLGLEKLKLQYDEAVQELKKINAMKPMKPRPPMPEPEELPEPEIDLGVPLREPYRISGQQSFDGSSPETAMICWVRSDTVVDAQLMEALRLQAEKLQNLNRVKLPSHASAPDYGDIFDDSTTPTTLPPQTDPIDPPETDPTDPPETDPTDPPETDPTDPSETDPTDPTETDPTDPSGPVDPEGTDPTDPADPSGPPETRPEEPIHVEDYYVVFKITEGNMSLGGRQLWQGMHIYMDGSSPRFKFFNAGSMPDFTLVLPEPDFGGQEVPTMPEYDIGSGMTAGQIAKLRRDQEKKIKQTEFQVRVAENDYKIKQSELSDGNVYAKFDGVVMSLLSQEDAKQLRQPMLKVSGGGGFYIEGTVSELSREDMKIGQEVTVNDWNTGMMYTGQVVSVGDFPSTSYGYGGGNPNVSYFPFQVFVDESADLQAGSYVSMTYSAGESENGVYLEKPFLRTEGGKSYVYVMGEDGKLEKRNVTTGKSLWGSYTEITSGLTAEDMIAFPYGKNVRPGAAAVPGEMSDLYGG